MNLSKFPNTSVALGLAVILVAAIIAQAAVSLYVHTPSIRLSLGLGLLVVTVWTSAELGIIERLTRRTSHPLERRFVRLRRETERFLAEVRRMNWLAVDSERGFRDQAEAAREMDGIENRMTEAIQRLRQCAGITGEVQDEPKEENVHALKVV